MDERIKFIADVLRGDDNITELCQIYNISRKTGYKWNERFQESGPSGLEELKTTKLSSCDTGPDRETDFGIALQAFNMGSAEAARDWKKRKVASNGQRLAPSRRSFTALAYCIRRSARGKVTPSSSPLAVITAPNQV